MKKNIILISIIFSFILSACGKTENTDTISTSSTGTKTPYLVKTLSLGSQSGTLYVEKTGRITASSSLTLTSQGAGEIAKILVKEGQKVKAGSTVAVLKDTVNNFDLRLSQAENALTVQDASINTTKVNLSQSVDNAKIALERAQQAYATLTAKNSIQYSSILNTNNKTLEAYNQNYKSYLNDIERLMTQYLYDADKVLGMTTAFEDSADDLEPYLGTRNGDSYTLAKNAWNELYTFRGEVRSRKTKETYLLAENLSTNLEFIGSGYTMLQKFSDAMIYMMQNNVVGGSLPQSTQDGWITLWNTSKATIQGSETGFNAWKAQTISFFKSYKNTELANKLAVASLSRELTGEEKAIIEGSLDMQVTYETARISLHDAYENAKLSLEQAELGYANALKIQEVTLTQLEATRRNAEISLDQARRDYSKLSISAPIDGTITKVTANVGQTINVGSPVAEFSGKLPQVVLDIDTSLASSLLTGDSVVITTSDSVILTGVISAVSNVSNANLLSTVRISVQNGEKYIGQSVTITFTSRGSTVGGNSFLLPINAVKIISEEEGEVYTISSSGTLSKKTIKLGKVGDTSIEIFGSFDTNESIITTDMSNFDDTKNTITLQ